MKNNTNNIEHIYKWTQMFTNNNKHKHIQKYITRRKNFSKIIFYMHFINIL